eukprot:51044_1
MAEIINIQVGACGNRIGNLLWSTILEEHWLDNDGTFINQCNKHIIDWTENDYQQIEMRLTKINSYFREIDSDILYGYIRQNIEQKYTKLMVPNDIKYLLQQYFGSSQKYVPRSILIDTDPTVLDSIKASTVSNLFTDNNFIVGESPLNSNWAKGHYGIGSELMEDIMCVMHSHVEKCNSLQGFQMVYSIGGGTGGGLGTLINLHIHDNYPDKIISNFAVYPSTKLANVSRETYNAILSINQLCENSDLTFVLDNSSLYFITHRVLKVQQPSYEDLNWICSLVLSGVTSTLRFPAQYNNDLHESLRKVGMNLIPFPRLHFLLLAQAPLFTPGQGKNVKLTREYQDEIFEMWSSRNFISDIKSEDGKYLSTAEIFRGDFKPQEVDDEVDKTSQKMAGDFVTWIPNLNKKTIINIPPSNTPKTGTFIANTTAIKGVFQKIRAQFAKLYKTKAFLQLYKNEFEDVEMEFEEADQNIRDLIIEYQDKQDAIVDLESDDSEYDSEEEEEEDW